MPVDILFRTRRNKLKLKKVAKSILKNWSLSMKSLSEQDK